MKNNVISTKAILLSSISITLLSFLACEKMAKEPPTAVEPQTLAKSSVPASLSSIPDITVNTSSDVADFGGSQQVGDLPGPDGMISLREALIAANNTPGPQVIGFNIPTSDPGFDGTAFTIRPLTALPALTDGGTTIDGMTQTAFSGDTNLVGPEIVINGSLAPAGQDGLNVGSSQNRIQHLVINGFPGIGVLIEGNNNVFQNNFVGTDATGESAIGNSGRGVDVRDSGNILDGNLISGNGNIGVGIKDSDNTFENNFVGTNATGSAPIANNDFGVWVSGSNHLIKGNLISGNKDNGIALDANRCRVEANKIGTDVTGTNPLPNGPNGGTGVSIAEHSTNNVVVQNLIAFNLGTGVAVTQTSFNNTISRNSIFSNHGLGIDLGVPYHGDGVTPNDPGDTDIGSNNLMNFPVLTSAKVTPANDDDSEDDDGEKDDGEKDDGEKDDGEKDDGKLVVKGTIDTPNPRTVTIEFFANPVPSPGGDPSGHGEGAVFLGKIGPKKHGKFKAKLPPVQPGTLITATATDADGNTSEFSAYIEAKRPGPDDEDEGE